MLVEWVEGEYEKLTGQIPSALEMSIHAKLEIKGQVVVLDSC